MQERLIINRRRPGARKAKANYLLSSKLFCGNCGRVITGSSGTSKTGKVYNYYRCGQKNCSRTLQKDILEKLVVDATTQYILIPDQFADIAHRCVEIYKKETADTDMLASLQSQLTLVDKKIANIMTAIEAGIITASTKERLTQLDQQKIEIETEIKNRQANNSLPEVTEKHIIYMLQEFYDHRADVDFYDRIIDGFIHKVYLYDSSLYVIYNLIDTGKDINKADINAMYKSSYIEFTGDPPGT